MFLVGLLAAFGGAVAMGGLAYSLGGPAWIGAIFPVLPGAYVSLRISTADALAAALAAAALLLALRGRSGWAVAAAVAAVLAREVTVVVFVGWAFNRRDRLSAALIAIPLAVGAALAFGLRLVLPRQGTGVIDFTWPVKGLVDAVRHWAGGHDIGAAVFVGLAVGLAAGAIVLRGIRSPLGGVVLVELLLVLVLRVDAHALWLNATRVEFALVMFSVVALACPADSQALPATPGLTSRNE
jgi:hypothetical protein